MNKTTTKFTLGLQITLICIVTLFLTSFNNPTNQVKFKVDNQVIQERSRFFSFTPITEVEYRNGFKNNYNATLETKIIDTAKLEKAFKSIEKTYSLSEKELAKRELCISPRCLTFYKGSYPSLDLNLFYIFDLHYPKACFVFGSTNEMASANRRFRGDFGVMSKNGIWVGLERQDCDNFLQIEICKSSKIGVWSIFKFDFANIDINQDEKFPMFWASKNTIYIATKDFDPKNGQRLLKYYAIKFDLEETE